MWILNFGEKIIYAVAPPLIRWQRFIRYAMVGGVAASGDFVVYFFLTRTNPWFAKYYLMANICAFTVGVTVAYFLNKSWTFQQGKNFIALQYLKFIVGSLVALMILQICLYVFVSVLNMYDMIAKVLLLVISSVINFSFSTLWTFKKSKI